MHVYLSWCTISVYVYCPSSVLQKALETTIKSSRVYKYLFELQLIFGWTTAGKVHRANFVLFRIHLPTFPMISRSSLLSPDSRYFIIDIQTPGSWGLYIRYDFITNNHTDAVIACVHRFRHRDYVLFFSVFTSNLKLESAQCTVLS